MAVSVIPFVFPGVGGVRCAFQTRVQGVSQGAFAGGNIALSVGDVPEHAMANRAFLAQTLGLDTGCGAGLAELDQVHGKEMVFEPQPVCPHASSFCQASPHFQSASFFTVKGSTTRHDANKSASCADTREPVALAQADGLATSRSRVGLLIKTADCQPLLLAHASGKYVAALHVGWKGNRIAFVQSGVAAFCAYYHIQPHELFAVRGPSLGPGQAEFIHFDQEWGASFSLWFDRDSHRMDLWKLTRDQLCEAGLRNDRIFSLDLCTFSLDSTFFSYRKNHVTGRQGSVIWIE